jgi:hypothetical protein
MFLPPFGEVFSIFRINSVVAMSCIFLRILGIEIWRDGAGRNGNKEKLGVFHLHSGLAAPWSWNFSSCRTMSTS